MCDALPAKPTRPGLLRSGATSTFERKTQSTYIRRRIPRHLEDRRLLEDLRRRTRTRRHHHHTRHIALPAHHRSRPPRGPLRRRLPRSAWVCDT